MKPSKNSAAPHRAVIRIEAKVYEVLKTGECSGMVVEEVRDMVQHLDGADASICIRKLNEFLAGVKQQCKSPA